ncbi:MAG: cell division protein ZapE [Rhizobiaceae bacterium]
MHVRDGIQTHPSVAQRYEHLVSTGAIERDPAQLAVAVSLDRLIADIATSRLAAKSSALGWLFGSRRQDRSQPRGLYIQGGVGRGKTMLMDMFFELVPARRKRRVHFIDFMADVQDRIQRHREARKAGTVREDDPIPPVARDIAGEARVLCFDEFSVTDIADAMILSRLFSALFGEGVVLVATSNALPEELYRDGLNRQLFLPFVDILRAHTQVLTLDSRKDYRQDRIDGLPVYLTPDGAVAAQGIDKAWAAMTHGHPAAPAELALKGRHIAVPLAAGRAARFSFADLCERPLGARDFLAIAGAYDTLFVEHVPVLDQSRRNEAKRFILLVDTLYDHKTRLVVSAAAEPESLYTATRGQEAFEFERTASRLREMRSRDWLEAWRDRHASGQNAAAE